MIRKSVYFIWLAQVAENGQLVWVRQVIPEGLSESLCVTAVRGEGVIVGGTHRIETLQSPKNALVQKIDLNGFAGSCQLSTERFVLLLAEVSLNSVGTTLQETNLPFIDQAVVITPNTTLRPDTLCLQTCADGRIITHTTQPEATAAPEQPCGMSAANAFSPNGDGLNDRFYPLTGDCICRVRMFQVLNRQGQGSLRPIFFSPVFCSCIFNRLSYSSFLEIDNLISCCPC